MTAKSRPWLEPLKSLLILLLTASAVFLLSRSPLVQNSGFDGLLEGSLTGDDGQEEPSSALTAVTPARMAAGNGMGLYGVQYDRSASDALFEAAAPLLGEALRLAGESRPMTQSRWRQCLEGECLWFDFTSPIPLSALCAWLEEGGENPALTDSARYLLLTAGEEGTLSLCWQTEEGDLRRADTGLDGALHLSPILDSVTSNGAFFAFEDSTLPSILSPYTLFTGGELSPAVYTASTPGLLSGGDQTGQLLSALSFSTQNRAEVSEGVLYVDGEDTLRLYGDGIVEYSSASGRYPAGEGLSGAVDAAWTLAQRAVAPLCGDARLYLISAETEEDGSVTVTFGYMLDGCVVELYDRGWAARFRVEGGSVCEFILCLRTYTDSGQTRLLLPAERAAAALTALTDDPKELVIRYRDSGSAAVIPGWVAC